MFEYKVYTYECNAEKTPHAQYYYEEQKITWQNVKMRTRTSVGSPSNMPPVQLGRCPLLQSPPR